MNGTWQMVDIAGKSADVFDPAVRPRFGLLYLHTYGQETLRQRDVFARLIAENGFACVCPQGGQCWWADRVCPAFDPVLTPERWLLDRVLPYFAQRWDLHPRAIALFGISMGGQGALRLAFKHPDTFPIVVSLSGAIEHHEVYGQGTHLDAMYDSKEQCRQDTAPMHVNPNRYPRHILLSSDPEDEWTLGNDRLHEKLNALGVPHEADLTTRAGGHSYQYFNHQAGRVFAFLRAALEQESRRLL
jgi:pimeloyl-ACP methyl ester carboxylesterase